LNYGGEASVVIDTDGDVYKQLPGRGLTYVHQITLDAWASAPSTKDTRPLAIVKTYAAADALKTEKKQFNVNEAIGVDAQIKDAAGNIVTSFNGEFAIPIMKYDPVQKQFIETVKRLKLTFTNGVASRTFTGFDASGDYGVDSSVSDLARIPQPYIITIVE
jgi:hypothetical protein